MKNLILVLGCFFFLISCQQTEKEKLEELVKNWNGKEVLFPTNPSFTLYGKTPVDFKVILDRWDICISVDSNDERLCLMTKETDGGEERYHYYCYQLN